MRFTAFGSTIGGTAGAPGSSPAERNVFGGNGTAIRTLGQGTVSVLGNYFGVKPDGTTAAPNSGDAIKVVSGSAMFPNNGTVIGGTVGSVEAGTTTCDGACNVIANSGDDGIDLGGDGFVDAAPRGAPPSRAISLGSTGPETRRPKTAGAWRLSDADSVTVGGSSTGARNYLAANIFGITSTSGATGLAVQQQLLRPELGGGGEPLPTSTRTRNSAAPLPSATTGSAAVAPRASPAAASFSKSEPTEVR